MRWYVMLAALLSGCAQPIARAPQEASQQSANAVPVQDNVCRGLTTGKKAPETNITEIANVLRGGDFKKSEFEKTSQFKARMAGRVAQAQQKIARTGQGNLFYFILPIPSDQIIYEADYSHMKIGGEYASLVKTSVGGDGELVVNSTWRPSSGGTYIGENAYGAKRQITRIDSTELVVTAPARVGGVWWPYDFKGVTLHVPQDQAKRTKENLVVLFAARLRDPYFEVRNGHFNPTINAPYDVTTRKEIVHLEMECAVIYDRAAAKVIEELSLAVR
jgi:hypothetical protein